MARGPMVDLRRATRIEKAYGGGQIREAGTAGRGLVTIHMLFRNTGTCNFRDDLSVWRHISD